MESGAKRAFHVVGTPPVSSNRVSNETTKLEVYRRVFFALMTLVILYRYIVYINKCAHYKLSNYTYILKL